MTMNRSLVLEFFNSDVEFKRRISSAYTPCAILLTGSSVTPKLIDSHSDIDLVVVVEELNIITKPQQGDHIKYKDKSIHWSYLSLDVVKNFGNMDHMVSLRDNPFLYDGPLYEGFLLNPIWCNEVYKNFLPTYVEHIDEWKKICAIKYIKQHYRYLLKLIVNKCVEENYSKVIHHLIRCYYILEDNESAIDWDQLLRIKRIRYVPVLQTDIEFIDSLIPEIIKYSYY